MRVFYSHGTMELEHVEAAAFQHLSRFMMADDGFFYLFFTQTWEVARG